jgi:orotidine-5'-phosphate decarboxylase
MKQAKEYIIFPLDVPSLETAKPFVEILSGHVGMFKVGLELFIHEGSRIIKMIHEKGNTEIFLDLKLHDIPTTVQRAMQIISEFGVRFTTVHCGESGKMLEAAVNGSQGKTGVLGVTVLTSVNSGDIRSAGFQEQYAEDIQKLVIKRATMAKEAGCAGIVCSGHEAMHVKKTFGDAFFAVTPGIRPSWETSGKDDQKRVMTPACAIQNGSDYLVIGRPIRDAVDPVKAAQKIATEIEESLSGNILHTMY